MRRRSFLQFLTATSACIGIPPIVDAKYILPETHRKHLVIEQGSVSRGRVVELCLSGMSKPRGVLQGKGTVNAGLIGSYSLDVDVALQQLRDQWAAEVEKALQDCPESQLVTVIKEPLTTSQGKLRGVLAHYLVEGRVTPWGMMWSEYGKIPVDLEVDPVEARAERDRQVRSRIQTVEGARQLRVLFQKSS